MLCSNCSCLLIFGLRVTKPVIVAVALATEFVACLTLLAFVGTITPAFVCPVLAFCIRCPFHFSREEN